MLQVHRPPHSEPFSAWPHRAQSTNSRVLQGALIWVPFLGFWLFSPGDTSRSPVSSAQAQIRRKPSTPFSLHRLSLAFWG